MLVLCLSAADSQSELTSSLKAVFSHLRKYWLVLGASQPEYPQILSQTFCCALIHRLRSWVGSLNILAIDVKFRLLPYMAFHLNIRSIQCTQE